MAELASALPAATALSTLGFNSTGMTAGAAKVRGEEALGLGGEGGTENGAWLPPQLITPSSLLSSSSPLHRPSPSACPAATSASWT